MSGLAPACPLAPPPRRSIVHRAETGTTCSRCSPGRGTEVPTRTRPLAAGWLHDRTDHRWLRRIRVVVRGRSVGRAGGDGCARHRCTSWRAGTTWPPSPRAPLHSRRRVRCCRHANAMEQSSERMVGIVERSSCPISRSAPRPSPVLRRRCSWTASLIDGLLVVGASSHHGAGAFWLGSTARHLVRHAALPGRGGPGCGESWSTGSHRRRCRRSAASDRALRWASDEADLHHVELSVVHGWWYPYEARTNAAEQLAISPKIDAAGVLEEAEAPCSGSSADGRGDRATGRGQPAVRRPRQRSATVTCS